jgi:predicted nucleotidyltransferase
MDYNFDQHDNLVLTLSAESLKPVFEKRRGTIVAVYLFGSVAAQ